MYTSSLILINPASYLPLPVLFGLMATVSLLMRNFETYDRTTDYISSLRGYSDEDVFDFIIVGAGSAGSVIANRLSRHFKVLVLEAGGEPNPFLLVPAAALMLEGRPQMDWMYQTVPQTHACLGLKEKRSKWPRGKAEGGSSNLNAMIYLRGNPQDYDNWAATLNDPLWSYYNVSRFFRSIEDFADFNPAHGHGNEQYVQEVKYRPLVDQFVSAGEELGYQKVDLNGYHTEGFSPLTVTVKNGVRFEDYSAFLKPAKQSPLHRLSVYKYAHALKVLVDENKRAYGVQYKRHGKVRTAYAHKEVIISAGAVNSPQLLMLSGIGPRQHLESLGIKVVADLPVGRNLQDHVGTTLGMFQVDQPLPLSFDRDAKIGTLFKYLFGGSGPLSNSGTYGVASVSSNVESYQSNSSKYRKWPDVQITLLGFSLPKFYKAGLDILNLKPEAVNGLWGKTFERNTFQMFVLNSRPLQRGEIKLASIDPFTHPLIDPKYLQNRKDVAITVEGIKLAVKLVTSTKTFASIGGKLINIPLPPCAAIPFASDAYWECYIRHLTLTLYHPCCTCPMGREGDYNRVSDSNFNVVGIKDLRVIDASSFPYIPTSNLNAPSNMVGEVGAYLIKKRWGVN